MTGCPLIRPHYSEGTKSQTAWAIQRPAGPGAAMAGMTSTTTMLQMNRKFLPRRWWCCREQLVCLADNCCSFFPTLAATRAPAQTTLPGTKALIFEGDTAAKMVDGIHAFLLRETAASPESPRGVSHRDYRSTGAFERSISPNRERLRTIIGAVDPRRAVTELQLEATTANSAEIAKGRNYRVYAVR